MLTIRHSQDFTIEYVEIQDCPENEMWNLNGPYLYLSLLNCRYLTRFQSTTPPSLVCNRFLTFGTTLRPRSKGQAEV
jgi:hypothetical protein